MNPALRRPELFATGRSGSLAAVLAALALAAGAARAAGPRFEERTVDDRVGIGYGVAVSDVDGDGKPDIVLVDKDVVAWYRNPGWEKSVIAEKLTRQDHVCIAARDLDGDGKAEVAAGAGWNPSDTVNSGSLHYLVPPDDRTKRWEPVTLLHEPTVHRIRWALGPGKSWWLVSAPLHGRGNKDAQGAGVRVLAYRKPADPRQPWPTELLDDSLHVIHNLEIVDWREGPDEEVLLAAREGVFHYRRGHEKWERTQLAGKETGHAGFPGAGEIRAGGLPGGSPGANLFLATIEPFHGNQLVAYALPGGPRNVLDDALNGGHALACGDLLKAGSDQVVAGWRLKDKNGKVGIRLYAPLDPKGEKWEKSVIDDNAMACEDLVLADLDRDGLLDVVAAGRDTHNLKVYWNRGPSTAR